MLLSASSTPSLFHSRRLLLHTTLHSSAAAAAAAPPPEPHAGDKSFDANIVMVLSFLLCALICAFGLNLIIRCALRCTRRRGVDSIDDAATRLANKGVKRKVLNTFSVITYSESSNQAGLDIECSICISEFTIGERVRVLPKCNHRFHLKCIDKWLVSHSSCPTCRHCLLEKCQKIVGCSEASSSNSSPAPSEVSIIMPLEPEGVVRSNSSFWTWVAHKPIAR